MARIKDIYAHITDKIVAELENGVRPWMKPWNAEHAAGRITRPLRHNGIPYNGINILMLWTAALDYGYSAPYWLTYKQAKELVRRSAKANAAPSSSTPTPIPAPKRMRTANRKNIKSPSSNPTASSTLNRSTACRNTTPRSLQILSPIPSNVSTTQINSSPIPAQRSGTEEPVPSTHLAPTVSRCRLSKPSAMQKAMSPLSHTRQRTGHGTLPVSTATSDATNGAMRDTPARSWLPNSAPPSFPLTSASHRKSGTTTRPI